MGRLPPTPPPEEAEGDVDGEEYNTAAEAEETDDRGFGADVRGRKTARVNGGKGEAEADSLGRSALPSGNKGGKSKGRGGKAKGRGAGRGGKSAHKGSAGGLTVATRGGRRGQSLSQSLNGFHIQDPNVAWAIALLAKQVCRLSQKQRKHEALLFDRVESLEDEECLTAALRDRDRYFKHIEQEGEGHTYGSLGWHMTLAYIEALETKNIGQVNRDDIGRFLEACGQKTSEELEAMMPCFYVESMRESGKVRVVMSLRSLPVRLQILDSCRLLGMKVRRDVPPPSGLERLISDMATQLSEWS